MLIRYIATALKNLSIKNLIFIILLPVFFVLHGFTENYDFVTVPDALELIGLYLFSSFILLTIFYLLFNDWLKAALMVLMVMGFHFFFGSVYDSIQSISPGSLFARYSFIIPALIIGFTLTIILLKRKKNIPTRLSTYLNTLFVLLIIIDGMILVNKHISLQKQKRTIALGGFETGKALHTPDIYFIILDEYGGLKQLKEQLGFDNSLFEKQLTEKQFHVIRNSSSNYFSTPYSVATFLTMDYINFTRITQQQDKVLYSYDQIRQSVLLKYLKMQDYSIFNFSIFDLPGQKTLIEPTFLPTGKKLITTQTFISRVKENLGYHLYTTFGFKTDFEQHIYKDLENNNKLYDRTFDLPSAAPGKPKFVYTHLTMPHYPYYFTKEGKERPINELLVATKPSHEYYLEYLQWCSNKALALVGEIKRKSPSAIIVLASDHGFRASEIPFDQRYMFYNLTAVYLPSQRYNSFYEGLSSVNLFRVILNTEFQQQLPMLKDSCMFDH